MAQIRTHIGSYDAAHDLRCEPASGITSTNVQDALEELSTGSLVGEALTRVNDTNITVTLGGTPATALLKATSITVGWTGTLAAARLNANVVQSVVNDTNVTGSVATQALTLGWTGTLAVARGGIGVGTLASNGVVYGNGTGAVNVLAVNATATRKFLSQTSSATPAWNQPATADISDMTSLGASIAKQSGVATIASASTTDLGSSDSQSITVSGTIAITSFGSTAPTGAVKFVRFSGALTLTHNATSLIMPNGVSVKTVSGDMLIARHEGSGNWRVLDYIHVGGNIGCSVYLSAPETGVPSDRYFQLFLDTAVYNDSYSGTTIWDTSGFALRPPDGARRIECKLHIWCDGGLATSNGQFVVKLIKGYTLNNNCLVSGTDVKAAIGGMSASLSGTGIATTSFDFSHTDGDTYALFVYTTGVSGATSNPTMTIASPCVVTDAGHGLTANQTIKFTTSGALPTGLTAGQTYFVVGASITANTYQVSLYPGGTAINTSGSQSGTHTRTTMGTTSINSNLAHSYATFKVLW